MVRLIISDPEGNRELLITPTRAMELAVDIFSTACMARTDREVWNILMFRDRDLAEGVMRQLYQQRADRIRGTTTPLPPE